MKIKREWAVLCLKQFSAALKDWVVAVPVHRTPVSC